MDENGTVSSVSSLRRSGLALGLLGVTLLGCEPGGGGSSRSRPALPPPPLLLESFAPPVREQFLAHRQAVEDVLADEPWDSDRLSLAVGELGTIYHVYGVLAGAKTCYRTAHGLSPGELRWAYYLGHVERALGRYDAADRAFETALQIRPGDVPTLVWLGENALDRHRLQRAESYYRQAVERDRACAKARFGLARIALERNEPEAAIDHLGLALASQPSASEVLYSLGVAYRDLGDSERARSFFDKTATSHLLRVPLVLADPLMQAIAELRSDATVHEHRGMRALARGRHTLAESELRRAFEIDPGRRHARHNHALVLLELGRREEARRRLEELVRDVPGLATSHVALAKLLVEAGELEAAEGHLRDATRAEPGWPRGHLELARFLRRSGRLEEAERSEERARELHSVAPRAVVEGE